jgi:hypothetical protein
MGHMSIRHVLCAAALALALPGSSLPAAAAAQADPCGLLFVPEGYQLRCSVHRGIEDDWRLVVRPVGSPFAALSELSIEPLEEPVADRQVWLRNQLRLDLSSLEHVVRELAEGDDSPFADEEVARPLEAWLGVMTALAAWPLQSCEEPSAIPGSARRDDSELTCEWEFGPFHQHLVIRLVERDGRQYVVRVRAMNERRLRHLVAIANSL